MGKEGEQFFAFCLKISVHLFMLKSHKHFTASLQKDNCPWYRFREVHPRKYVKTSRLPKR